MKTEGLYFPVAFMVDRVKFEGREEDASFDG